MKIGVILVTYNRLEKLKIALECYDNQELQPEYIYVINNKSTDGTDEFLKEWEKKPSSYNKYVKELPYNSGGAGGFYAGLKEGMELDAEWLWVSDDDAYTEPNTFSKLSEYYEELSVEEQNGIASLCSAVINEGEIHYAHRNRINKTLLKCKHSASTYEDYQKKAFDIDIFSYVGTMIKKNVLKNAGLPEKEFFIYCDDQEHSIRVRKQGRIVVVSDSKVIHNTPGFGKKEAFWGDYYFARNDIVMMKKHFPARYYLLKVTKAYFVKASIFSKNTKEMRELYTAAYRDAVTGRLGIHEIYKPGWKTTK